MLLTGINFISIFWTCAPLAVLFEVKWLYSADMYEKKMFFFCFIVGLIVHEAMEKVVFTRVSREDYLKTMLLIRLEKCEKAFKFE